MFADLCFYVLPRLVFDKPSLQNGTPVPFNSRFTLRRFVKPTDAKVHQFLAKELSSVCQEALGSVLSYPIFKGEGFDNKLVALLYPNDDPSAKPCAFSVSFLWDFQGQECIHYGLVMVAPTHRGKGIQVALVVANLLLKWTENTNLWVTDLGRSPSGSRNFCLFQCDTCPFPISEKGESCEPREPHLSIARAFHEQFRADAGMSTNSKLEGFVVKGSNGPGGAEALVAVNGTTRSRNAKFNNWIDQLCPNPADEVIMVGKFSLSVLLKRKLKQNMVSLFLAASLIVVLIAFRVMEFPF